VTRPAGDGANAARERALEAADAYRRRFGTAFGVRAFLGHPKALERELRAAVRRNEPVTAAELRQRLGMAPLPPGAIL
jgi:hypothetical protein